MRTYSWFGYKRIKTGDVVNDWKPTVQALASLLHTNNRVMEWLWHQKTMKRMEKAHDWFVEKQHLLCCIKFCSEIFGDLKSHLHSSRCTEAAVRGGGLGAVGTFLDGPEEIADRAHRRDCKWKRKTELGGTGSATKFIKSYMKFCSIENLFNWRWYYSTAACLVIGIQTFLASTASPKQFTIACSYRW